MRNFLLGLALMISGAIIIAAGAIIISNHGFTGSHPFLLIAGGLSFVAGLICFFIPNNNQKS